MNFIQGYLLVLYVAFILYLIGKTILFQVKTNTNPIMFLKRKNTVESFSWGMLMLIIVLYGFIIVLTAQGKVIGFTFSQLYHDTVYTAGIVLTLIGFAIVILAHHAMGLSWRMGIDREQDIKLVTTGFFSLSRNPVYVGVITLALGLIFLLQTIVSLVLFFVFLQAIYVVISTEERFLWEKFGEEYGQYVQKVRRFL